MLVLASADATAAAAAAAAAGRGNIVALPKSMILATFFLLFVAAAATPAPPTPSVQKAPAGWENTMAVKDGKGSKLRPKTA